ncbi:MAG: DUF3014 domain-containing protein, partial [Acidobacteria bacterium]|nr:DUF3014 domain-containing protein [Acidobacteriota bacterium]
AVYWFRKPADEPKRAATETAKPVAPPAARGGLGPDVQPIDLPPLVLTDPLVRDLVGKLSSKPELVAWLATDGLIRNLVVCIDNVAGGESPARHLRVLAPRAPFRAENRGNTLAIDPRAFGRYDGIADTAASLDAPGVARTYSLLKPRLIEAYKELGHPDGDIDAAVEKAIVVLLQTPAPDGNEALVAKVLSFKYQNQDLEALPSAQKHLLRTGPRNVRLVQESLRAIARELGVPFDRLPPRPAA